MFMATNTDKVKKRGALISPVKKAEVVARLLSGEKVARIAKATGLARPTIYGIQKSWKNGELTDVILQYLPDFSEAKAEEFIETLSQLEPPPLPPEPLPPPPTPTIVESISSDDDKLKLSDACISRASRILSSITDKDIEKAPIHHKIAAFKTLTETATSLIKSSTSNMGLLGQLLDEINQGKLSIRVGVSQATPPQIEDSPIDTFATEVVDV